MKEKGIPSGPEQKNGSPLTTSADGKKLPSQEAE